MNLPSPVYLERRNVTVVRMKCRLAPINFLNESARRPSLLETTTMNRFEQPRSGENKSTVILLTTNVRWTLTLVITSLPILLFAT
jgi:hypothetical protein